MHVISQASLLGMPSNEMHFPARVLETITALPFFISLSLTSSAIE